MSCKKGLISIILPVYNGEKYIGESVSSILNQSFKNFELLVLNDGSIDGSRDIIKGFNDPRIQLVDNEENLGLTKTLNKGLKLCSGEYVARMDADDICLPNRLQVQFDFLEKNSEVDVVGSNFRILGTKTTSAYPDEDNKIKLKLNFENALAHPTVMFRQAIAQKFSYPSNVLHCEDWLFWSELAANDIQFANLNEVLLEYRMEGQNISVINNDSKRERFLNAYHIILNRLYTAELSKEELNLHFELCTGHVNSDVNRLKDYVEKLNLALKEKSFAANDIQDAINQKINSCFYKTADINPRKAYEIAKKFKILNFGKIKYLIAKKKSA